MKIKLLLFVSIFLFKVINAQIDKVFKINIEDALISKDDNFPDFDIEKNNMNRFLISLHQGYSIKDFQEYTKYNNEKIDSIISILESKNFLHKINNEYKPTIFIADRKDGEKLYEYAKPISKPIAKSIKKEILSIENTFNTTDISTNHLFSNWSFLILSDVLLDSWQINDVEKFFLKKEYRPLRNGKNYYFSILENTNNNKEAFGIYGNQYESIDNNQYSSVYGNNRYNIKTISKNNIVSKSDNQIFKEIAISYLPKLLYILEINRKYSEKVYSKLGYNKEITFEEFFIWWYHFIYTQATNYMSKMELLKIPYGGNFEYIITE